MEWFKGLKNGENWKYFMKHKHLSLGAFWLFIKN